MPLQASRKHTERAARVQPMSGMLKPTIGGEPEYDGACLTRMNSACMAMKGAEFFFFVPVPVRLMI